MNNGDGWSKIAESGCMDCSEEGLLATANLYERACIALATICSVPVLFVAFGLMSVVGGDVVSWLSYLRLMDSVSLFGLILGLPYATILLLRFRRIDGGIVILSALPFFIAIAGGYLFS